MTTLRPCMSTWIQLCLKLHRFLISASLLLPPPDFLFFRSLRVEFLMSWNPKSIDSYRTQVTLSILSPLYSLSPFLSYFIFSSSVVLTCFPFHSIF